MSLGCAGCGACCEEIWIPISQAEITACVSGDRKHMVTSDRWAGRYQLDFFARYWRATEQKMVQVHDGTWVHKTRYECAKYDPVHQRCTAHAIRPQVCRGYPWYGKEPTAAGMSKRGQCSYLLDLPPDQRPEGSRPLIPLEVL